MVIPRMEKEQAEISFGIHHIQILSLGGKVNVENKKDNLDGNGLAETVI